METVIEAELDLERAKLADQKGGHWAEVHADALSKLAVGTTVIINVENGDYITGLTWFEALEKFEQRFGKDRAIGWSFEVGRPIFVGGGLWRS